MSVTSGDLPYDALNHVGLFVRLRRRKWRFIAIFVLVAGVVALIYAALPQLYLASGAVTVTSDSTDLGSAVSPVAEQKLGDPADMDTQIIIAKSPRLMHEMLRRTEVRQAVELDCRSRQSSPIVISLLNSIRLTYSCEVKLANNGAIKWLQQHFSIKASGRSRVIQISYEAPVADVATTLVDNLISNYIALATEDRQQSRAQAEMWIENAVARIGDQLRQSELDLENFRRDHGLVRGQTASIASEQLSQVSLQLASADAAMADAKGKLGQLRNGAANAPETLNNRTVADLKQQLVSVSLQFAKAASSYALNSPVLISLEQQQIDLQHHLAQETNHIRLSLESSYATANSQVMTLRQQLIELEHKVSVNDLAGAQVATMVRDIDIKRDLYSYLSKKAMDIEAQRRLLTGNVQLVNYAEIPDRIDFPKTSLFILAGLVLSTAVATAAAVVCDRSDPSVRRATPLANTSGVRVLGYIPQVRSGFAHTAFVQLDQPSRLQEAVRSLYTKCVILSGTKLPRIILITSANPHEGKSFLTLALARFGGGTGKRVLVVEADLRRCSFQNRLGISSDQGLVDILKGAKDYAQVVRQTSFGFDVVLAGKPTVASTELLSNGAIEHFLQWAQGQYDLVFIDSPPASVLMDAHILANAVDGVVYCVRWGRSTIDSVTQGVSDLHQDGAHVLGLALGMVKPREYRLYEPTPLLNEPYLIQV